MYKYERNKLYFNGRIVEPSQYWKVFTDAHGLDPRAALACEGLSTLFADHGDIALSTKSAKYACMTGGEFIDSVFAWLATFRGSSHGGAVLSTADMLLTGKVPTEGRIQGYGHHVHDNDPRVHWCLEIDLPSRVHRERYIEIGKSVNAPMNIAGAGTAMLLDAGLNKEICQFPFIIGRLIGISWHYMDELPKSRRHA